LNGVQTIGKPVDNTQIYILNNSNELVPQGVVGELCVGGRGVARGYLNREELSKEKFISNPFKEGEKIYKTGDLAQWLPNGTLEYIGRLDNQVKVRGYRIELGEIENALSEIEEIKKSCVLAKEDTSGNKRLVGYVVVDKTFDKDVIQQKLKARLPDYMVPMLWVEIATIPLTASGKLDRKALPDVDGTVLSNTEYVAPRNETEEELVTIWQEILGLTKIGVYDNFFELGGHSLLVIQLISRLQLIGYNIEAKHIFSNATIVAISEKLSSSISIYEVPVNGIIKETNHITPSMIPLVKGFHQEDIDSVISQVQGGVVNIQDIYPLSPLQEGMYFHYLMSDNEGRDPYILSNLISFPDKEKRTSFIEALQLVVNRHDVLRTCVLSNGLPSAVQVVIREVILSVEEITIDLSKDILSELQSRNNHWMDVSKAPLLELRSTDDLEKGNYYLMINQHHLVLDHIGLEKVVSEIELYLSGNEANLSAPVLYRDFIGHTLHSQLTNDSESYFKKLFRGVEEPTYPFELSETKENLNGIKEENIILSKEFSKELRDICVKQGISPAVLFHAAYGIVVGRCSHKDYAIFGSLFSGRLQGASSSADSLGLFINTLPFFIELKGDVFQYITEVKNQLRGLLPYEQTSLSNIQNWSNISNEVPLFSALLNFRHSSPLSNSENIITELGAKIRMGHERTNYPFVLNVDDFGESFGITAQIDGGIEANRVLSYMQEVLLGLLKDLKNEGKGQITSLSLVPKSEKVQLLKDFNNTSVNYPKNKTIVDLFEEQIDKTPEATAVVCQGESLSYKELDDRSNQLAHYLVEQGVKADTLVGICLDRSLEMLVGVLGILKSGGAYVP
ncbi:AMP-binding protein, partial [Tenacibaculum sp.]|nr:AMP-binding protein [Tenacibaculum sp.]